MLTTIASTSTPVQEVQFPAVTVCPGPAQQEARGVGEPDRWGFAQEVLNSLRFECRRQPRPGFDCDGKTGALRERFRELIAGTFGLVVRQVAAFYSNSSVKALREGLWAFSLPADRAVEDDALAAAAALARRDTDEGGFSSIITRYPRFPASRVDFDMSVQTFRASCSFSASGQSWPRH